MRLTDTRQEPKYFYHRKTMFSFDILFAYIWIIFIMYASKSDLSLTISLLIITALFSLFLAFLLLFTLQSLPDYYPKGSQRQPDMKSHLIVLCVFLTFFTFYMVYFAGQFPGGVNADIYDQLAQALGETAYNDWHPVLHTLLFITLPLKIINHYGFAIFLQLLYLCLAFTYLIFVLYQNGGSKFFLGGLCLYILINPFLFTYSVYAMKDIAMMIFAIVLVGYYIQIICSKGAWLRRKRNIFLYAAAVILCSYMRHNAILFTGPLVLITLVYLLHFRHRRACVSILLSIALLFLCVKGLYTYLNVQQPWYRKLEKIGIPLSVWSNVIYSNPSALPDETREFIYQLIPAELEDIYSVDAGFNSIKSMDLVDYGAIDAISYRDVLKVTWQCFRYAPQETLEALAKLCDIVWEVDVPVSPMDVSITANDYGIQSQPVFAASVFVSQIKSLLGSGLSGTLLGSIGFELLIFVVLGAVFLSRNRMAVLHLVPFFCYDFGTMLLLTGRDYRFFLFNIPLWMPIIFLMFQDKEIPSRQRNVIKSSKGFIASTNQGTEPKSVMS